MTTCYIGTEWVGEGEEPRKNPLIWNGIEYLEGCQDAKTLANKLGECDRERLGRPKGDLAYMAGRHFFNWCLLRDIYENPDAIIHSWPEVLPYRNRFHRFLAQRLKNKTDFGERFDFLQEKARYYRSLEEREGIEQLNLDGFEELERSSELYRNYRSYSHCKYGLSEEISDFLIAEEDKIMDFPINQGGLGIAIEDAILQRKLTESQYNQFMKLVRHAYSLYEQTEIRKQKTTAPN
jgi:hypothetical protein